MDGLGYAAGTHIAAQARLSHIAAQARLSHIAAQARLSHIAASLSLLPKQGYHTLIALATLQVIR